ncbi:plastidic glucose transporter 4 [Drechmeria coniospora]|uniref:Plastidic glucose transporter 4 n=1 Tax=Drechmeria coniospora TaxID=98403 RepID=A0A151GY45_DRECN|nr:plastidic glucose transporter 4 [Drechmeria coniospora]KYK61962.1 plastidic glucose transporter 4 [Drechmeria coniospora]
MTVVDRKQDSAGEDSHGQAGGRSASTTTAPVLNPLAGMTNEEVLADADAFVRENGLVEHRDVFRKGALVAKTQNEVGAYESIAELTEDDKAVLRHEDGHKWRSSPPMLYLLCALCAGCAVVQGMDQTVINGAQAFYFREFQITDRLVQGLVNGSPYAAAALVGCWLNAPLNKRAGRRGTIAFSCFLAFVTALWQACSVHWLCFLVARFVLGLAVGAKSSTTPVYAAECAPKNIRGALTMMWQMWTAFGIMLGFAVSLAFQHLDVLGTDSQWRWMIGVTAVPPMVVGLLVYRMPESPRWHMERKEFARAFKSLSVLRKHDIQAARDMYLAYKLLAVGEGAKGGQSLLKEFFTVRRNRRAAQSAWFCMLTRHRRRAAHAAVLRRWVASPPPPSLRPAADGMPVTDGERFHPPLLTCRLPPVNVIAYYSTKIFVDAGYSAETAMLVSFGSGVCNFLGALPAVFTIDRYGRRQLLLFTFPVMAVFLFWTGSSFLIEEKHTRLASVAASLYGFMILYSPGLGPVPFTYSAEAFPLHIRALGMSSATAITWAFNFLISFTWPEMMDKFTAMGGFYWYAGWNVVGWVFTYFLLPETKGRTLEELDSVFSVRNRDHARYYMRKLDRFFRRLLGRDVKALAPLYATESRTGSEAGKPQSA